MFRACYSGGMEMFTFKTPKEFEKWLKVHHGKSTGIQLRFLKKAHKEASGEKCVTYAEALDVALCYGWIDSIAHGIDDKSYMQKFSPRGPRSVWSKRNTQHIARLIKEGRMAPAGLVAVAAAKKDGRWKQAYDGSTNMKIPADFLKELAKDKKAKTFFNSLNRANQYAVAYRLQTAKKPETLVRRKAAILAQLKAGKRFH
jgi:uncharacterized protein YdeI (YjbR/CyaY-like superfamily)